jgi:hypothetical protein
MLQETGDVIWLRPDRLTKSNTFTGLNAITITKRSMNMVTNAATNMATAKDMTTKLTRTAKIAIMATTIAIAITTTAMITITGAIAITTMAMITITGAITTTTTIAITAIIIIIIMNIAKVWSGRDRRRQVGMLPNLSLESLSPTKLMNLAGSRNSNCSWKLAQASPTSTCGATAAALKSAYIMTIIR